MAGGARSGGATDGARRRRRPVPPADRWWRLGLRARVTATFGLGALVLSATMACLTYLTARQFILHQRETSIIRQAYDNASLLRSTLPTTDASQIPQLLDSFDTGGARSVLEQNGVWHTAYSASFFRQEQIPLGLRTMVLAGRPAEQHFLLNGSPELAVGVPVPSLGAHYFEVFSLLEEAKTLRILALALAGAALVTTVVGAVIGRWASGRLLRPLGAVAQAAETIAGGRLDTRLTASDDPDLSRLTGSFNRMTDALQERIEREARFSSDVSHELRSPLTTLATALDVLEASAEELPDRPRQALRLLGDELRRFQHMVADLLEISRADTGATDLSLEEVEVGELVHQLAASGGTRGVPVRVDPRVGELRLWVDKRRIERVVANLIGNAAQYAGGATEVAAEAIPGQPDRVRLVVTDRGPGVGEEERQLIFERFYRGAAAGRRGATDGAGLGLSLVAEHVRLHGGDVWVEDAAGGGSRFVVELPAHRRGDATVPALQAAR